MTVAELRALLAHYSDTALVLVGTVTGQDLEDVEEVVSTHDGREVWIYTARRP